MVLVKFFYSSLNYILVGLTINFSFTCVKDNDGSIKGFPGAKVCKQLLIMSSSKQQKVLNHHLII